MLANAKVPVYKYMLRHAQGIVLQFWRYESDSHKTQNATGLTLCPTNLENIFLWIPRADVIYKFQDSLTTHIDSFCLYRTRLVIKCCSVVNSDNSSDNNSVINSDNNSINSSVVNSDNNNNSNLIYNNYPTETS